MLAKPNWIYKRKVRHQAFRAMSGMGKQLTGLPYLPNLRTSCTSLCLQDSMAIRRSWDTKWAGTGICILSSRVNCWVLLYLNACTAPHESFAYTGSQYSISYKPTIPKLTAAARISVTSACYRCYRILCSRHALGEEYKELSVLVQRLRLLACHSSRRVGVRYDTASWVSEYPIL